MADQQELKVEDIRKEAAERKCPVQQALFYVEKFLSGPMCGKCFPCALGFHEAKVRLQSIVSGRGTDDDISTLRRIARDVMSSSRCKKGKDSAASLLEWAEPESFEEHVAKSCQAKECSALIEYRVIPEKCVMCGECKAVCRYDAIIGEKRKRYLSGYLPFEIRQKRCVKCGECVRACPEEAIVLVDVIEQAKEKA